MGSLRSEAPRHRAVGGLFRLVRDEASSLACQAVMHFRQWLLAQGPTALDRCKVLLREHIGDAKLRMTDCV